MADNQKLQLALEKDLETVKTSVEEVKKIADAALPSADLTKQKILDLINILPFEKGGTNANTKKQAVDNLMLLGINPITASSEDTTQKWVALGNGYAFISQNNLLINQPYTYMVILNVIYGSDVFQIASEQKGNGAVYYRMGNDSGWYNDWKAFRLEQGDITSTTDANKIVTTGIYRSVGKTTNVPSNTYGLLLVFATTNDYVEQFYINNNSTGKHSFWHRDSVNSGSSWSNWYQIYTSNDTIPIANGGTGATTAATALSNLGGQTKVDNVTYLELGSSRTSAGNAYIDFHSNLNTDYDGRILVNSSKKMTLTAFNGVDVTNPSSADGYVRNIQISTTDLTAGSSSLATGKVYLIYE